ncbi:glycosyltransferase [Sphaerothrix gracilis]|uniref:glycosyltransferase n=1 Tax=Sphaerothrix gracilis TaxID=3151835 RepID=UPI0031FE3E35
MRIAYLTGEYPRATDTFIQREVAALRALGLEIQTFSIRRPDEAHLVGQEQREERDRTLYLLPANLLELLLAHIALLLGSPLRYFKALSLALKTCQPGIKGAIYQLFYFAEAGILAARINRLSIQHLHNHLANSSCTVAMLAAQLGGFTFSFTLHGPHIFFEPYRWRLDQKIKQALFVNCISHFCRSQAMLFAPVETWDKMHIIHCGVDLSLFEPTASSTDKVELLYVGRLAAMKGFPILLKSLVELKNTYANLHLTVVGDGEDRASLEDQVKQLGLQKIVEFVGYQSQSSVREYLKQTDIFVLPSFAEGVPVVLMEAMATQIPVIATRIAGISELVDDGYSGYLVPPGNTASLREKIEVLLQDADRRQEMGRRGRQKIEAEFSISSEAKKFKQVMDSRLRKTIQTPIQAFGTLSS